VPSCFDGIRNQNETEIDCGGPCAPCPSCFDGILNQGELDVDCGGPCAACDLVHENGTHLSWTTQVDGFVTSLRFSPDRSRIAVAWNDADGYISLFDDSGALLWTVPTLSPLSDVRFTEDGKFITPYPDSGTYLFDLNGVNRVVELRKVSESIGLLCGVSRGSDVFLAFDDR
jgi:WD40 repeat protein